jgi:peptide/nickel transport system permease protein
VSATTIVVTAPAPATSARRRSRFGLSAALAITWLVVIALLALLADVLPLHDYVSQAAEPSLGPNWSGEFLGTDSVGRSMLSRIVYGGRVSFLIGVGATALSMLVGGTLGLVSAYSGGALRSVIDVLANTVLAIPSLLFLLAVSIALKPAIGMLIVLLSVTTVPAFMRLTYANALAEMNKDYIVAAHLMGASSFRIMFREVLPNVVMPVVSYAVLVVPAMMIVEGSLSFLGFGVKAPRPTWGAMIAAGKVRLETNAWEAMTPCLVLFVTVFSLNRLGDLARERYGSRERAS